MWQGDFTFELSGWAGWWRSIVWGGTPKAEATCRSRLVIMTMKGRQTILGVSCTRCQLVIMTWRDREGWLNFVFRDDSRVVDEKEKDGGWGWEQCNYKRSWEIRGTTCLIWLGRPRIGVITRWIWTRTCCIGDGKFTLTRNSLKSQFLMIISPVPSHLSLSCAQFYHLRTQS